jgi:hypothetical protein
MPNWHDFRASKGAVIERGMTTKHHLADVEDGPLLETAQRLAREERHATLALLRALAEIDQRRLYLGEGYSSMFTYCTQVLHLSEGGAYNRIEACRAARRYPVIFDLLKSSALTLTAVRLLAPHLTDENHRMVLESARQKSKREVEVLVAALTPKPDAPTVVRRLAPQPAPASPPSPPSASMLDTPSTCDAPRSAGDARVDALPVRTPQARLSPLAPDRYRLQVTLTGATHEKFRRAQALLRHAVPTGDAAEILDRALSLLVEHLERQRFAETSRPRMLTPSAAPSRHIPAAVRRHVWQRDGGRCAFVGARGRCRDTTFLEFHHVEPYAVGGDATADNIALRCRAHNTHEARLYFGGPSSAQAGTTRHE